MRSTKMQRQQNVVIPCILAYKSDRGATYCHDSLSDIHLVSSDV